MINKQNLWFITLFSLILILGVYYITMPGDSLTVFSDIKNEEVISEVKSNESDIIVAMKIEAEEAMLNEMENARKTLLDNTASANEKNNAYEILQILNAKKGKTQEIEQLLKKEFGVDAFVKIDGNKINVTISSEDRGASEANKIIKSIQKLYDTQMYITIKFEG